MITGFTHTVQLSVFFKSVGLGFFLGCIFSIMMFFNTVSGKRAVVVFLRDMIFFITAGILSFMFALKYNAGILRFYIICGELIGFCLFYIFPAGVLRKQFSNMYNTFYPLFSESAKKILNVFSFPVRWLNSIVLSSGSDRNNEADNIKISEKTRKMKPLFAKNASKLKKRNIKQKKS